MTRLDPPSHRRSVVTGIAVLCVAAGSVGLVLAVGAGGFEAPAGPASTAAGSESGHRSSATRFLLVVAIVIALAHVLGWLARRLGQPTVVGEIIAGILLGPTVLGALSPHGWHWLFTDDVVVALDVVAQLGLVAFMLMLGMELRLDLAGRTAARTAPIALANLLVPLSFALPAAIPLYAGHGGRTATLLGFVCFFGLALSITALPVLARILKDMGMFATPIGTLALTSAAVCDLMAWIALTFVLAIAGAGTGVAALSSVLLAGAYLSLMLLAVRPLLAKLIARLERAGVSESIFLPVILVGAILSAVTTQAIGIHAALGALLFGAIMPRRTVLVGRVAGRIEGVTLTVLLPLFFAYVGLRTSLDSLGDSASAWLIWLGILVLAMSTKILGVSIVAKVNGFTRKDAVSLGVLLNCRGLTEIIVANMGLQLGIIDVYLFTALTLVALVTTALTTPLLRLLSLWGRHDARVTPIARTEHAGGR